MDIQTLKNLVDPQTQAALEALRPGVMTANSQDFLLALDLLACDVIKMLAADAIQKANSGHPGGLMSSVDFAHVLFSRFLNASENLRWPDRDRFILSAGHMSMLLYSLLQLQGRISLDDLKRFRQIGSSTQGHPVLGLCPGVETSTGPLGQGFANGVGMAIAEEYLRGVYGPEVVDHRTYVLATDGDFQEGICREAAALAAHLKLSKLTVFYDANGIQLASTTKKTMSENTALAFTAYGWHVLELPDGHDHLALAGAIRAAQTTTDRPTLIVGHTIMARDTTKAGSGEAHGSPLGQTVIDEFKTRKKHPGTPFWVPAVVRGLYEARVRQGTTLEAAWKDRLAAFEKGHPDLASTYRQTHGLADPIDILKKLAEAALSIPVKSSPSATRVSGGEALAGFRDAVPHLFGGSADLANSTKTDLFEKAVGYFPEEVRPGSSRGRAVYYGVREHGMGGITNGLAAHGGLLPFAATFLAFSDYMRGAIRVAAISRLPAVFVFTHDSFFVGEDGESHQPVEQTQSLRLIPRVAVLRPADAHEALASWRWTIEQAMSPKPRPVCLVLTRQNLPLLETTRLNAFVGLPRGAYVVHKEGVDLPHIQVIATGSEVHVAVAAAKLLLTRHGERARVISMPSQELFREQPETYQDDVLLPQVPLRLSVEAGTTQGWKEWTGTFGEEFGLCRFGESGPAEELAAKYGFTPEALAERMHKMIADFPRRWADHLRRAAGTLCVLGTEKITRDVVALLEKISPRS